MPAKHRLGALDFAMLSDGQFYLDAGATFGLVPRVLWEPFSGPLDDRHRLSLGLNSLLVRSQGKTILLETGVGDKPTGWRRQSSPVANGTLMTELAALGVAPEEIDVVVNTHLHADHSGWNTRIVDGRAVPTFPNAEYLIMEAEWRDAIDPNERTRATYIADNILPVQEHGRLHLIDNEYRITDEVTVVPTPGHTEGHAAVVLSSAGQTGVYIGDIAQVPVHLERTAWISAFDVLPLISLKTKRQLVENAIDNGSLIISVHLPFPGLGRMTRTETGHRKYEPIEASG